jgi:hypothetical protein
MKANKWTNYEALVKANPNGLQKLEKNVSEAVKEMFEKMEIGDITLSPSHSPTVECAFNYFINPDDRDEKMAIAPLDGIILVQTFDGKDNLIMALR